MEKQESKPTTEPNTEFGRLALAFPALTALHRDGRSVPGIQPWAPERLDNWARGNDNPAVLIAVQFVLAIFDLEKKWKVGRFDLFTAASRLSGKPDWQPIAEWAAEPWLNRKKGEGTAPRDRLI